MSYALWYFVRFLVFCNEISADIVKLAIAFLYLNKQLETWGQNQLIKFSVMLCSSENTSKNVFSNVRIHSYFVLGFSFY